MSKWMMAAYLLAGMVMGLVVAWLSHREAMNPTLPVRLAIGERPKPVLTPSPTHAVTSKMAQASQGMINHEAADFSCEATDGKTYSLKDLCRNGPVLLTFTKVGCPCSEAAQPFFNQLASAFPRVAVLGVVNAEHGPASLWLSKIKPTYPHLLDPELSLVRGNRVMNSVYVVLIDTQGRVQEHWPGISQAMLEELAAKLGDSTSAACANLDFRLAPVEMYSGCPYDL